MSTDNSLFDTLYNYVNVGHPKGYEKSWSYLGMDIWPVVKSQIVMRGSNIFFAGRNMTLIKDPVEAEAPKASSGFFNRFFVKAKEEYPAPPEVDNGIFDEMVWPEFPLPEGGVPDVLALGYATNHKKFGETYFQLCMDPCRLALETVGYTTACCIAGLSADADGVENAALDDTFGIDAEFRAARRLSSQLPDVNLMGCKGFAQWWDDLDALLGRQKFVTIEHIENVIKQTRITAEWIYRTFKDEPPKAVLVAAYYGLMGHGASWAFRKLNVNIADIQHGVAGPGHHAYSWPNAPKESYTTLPTHFFLWSDIEKRNMITGSGDWKPGLVVIGNIWRLLDDILAYQTAPDVLVQEHRMSAVGSIDAFKRQFRATGLLDDPEKKNILLALHPDETLEWFPRFKKIMPDEWNIFIRLHPGEYNKAGKLEARCAALETENILVDLPTHIPLNVVLNETDIILTKYSSVAQDAMAYGIPTVAYSEAATHFFGPVEISQVKVVLPSPDIMVAGIKQRLSAYATDQIRSQGSCDFEELGNAITKSMV